ncbi:hypothetical protein ACFWG6_00640 [Streptomyces erythrochromogenes]|uniref:hypothetical protein n=1 Tax=Streptomyces erythrochromogenes TaxID=285574 RepID=UPI00363F9FB0
MRAPQASSPGSELAHERAAFVDEFPHGLAVVEVTVPFHGKNGKVGECLAFSGAGLPDQDVVGQLVKAAASGFARLVSSHGRPLGLAVTAPVTRWPAGGTVTSRTESRTLMRANALITPLKTRMMGRFIRLGVTLQPSFGATLCGAGTASSRSRRS